MNPEHEEGGADYFASMTDMVVGVLFVFIIMVAYFAFQVSNEDSVPLSLYEAEQENNKALMVDVERLQLEVKSLEEKIEELMRLLKQKDPMVAYIENASSARNDIVRDVIKELKKHNIDAQSTQKGVITISGKGLFANSSSDLSSVTGAEGRVKKLSDALINRIWCNVLVSDSDSDVDVGLVLGLGPESDTKPDKPDKPDYYTCNPHRVFIESVYVEGHTDNVPITNGRVLKDGSRNNLELSARRATNTYGLMVTHGPEALQMVNPDGRQVLSVAAYGEQRPIADNNMRAGRQNNRRIDIRFVMHVPKDQVALESLIATVKALE